MNKIQNIFLSFIGLVVNLLFLHLNYDNLPLLSNPNCRKNRSIIWKKKKKKEDNTISHHVTRNNYKIHNTFWTKDIFINNHHSTMDHFTMDSYITYFTNYEQDILEIQRKNMGICLDSIQLATWKLQIVLLILKYTRYDPSVRITPGSVW